MKEIDKKLNQWIYNSIIRAEVRKLIEDTIRNAQGNGFVRGYHKGMEVVGYKLNTNKDG